MCKKYSINKSNEEKYKQYLEWLSKQPENPYKDPDSNNKNKRIPEFYKNLSLFLNVREEELSSKLSGAYKYYFDEDDKTYGIKVKEITDSDEKLLFYLKSDQFGFSRPSEEQKYIYDVYLKYSNNKENAINKICNWISNTRTIGGSFLWPMEKEKKSWNQNPNYNKGRGGSIYGGKSYYIQDRSDLTLFELKDCYSAESNHIGNKLYGGMCKWPNMKKWLEHFKSFETYVEFFGFKLNNEDPSFINDKNDKYEVKNIFPFEEYKDYFDDKFSIEEYIDKYFKESNIYYFKEEEKEGYILKVEKMLDLVSELVITRSKWMEEIIKKGMEA